MNKLIIFFSLCFLITISSCKKEVCETIQPNSLIASYSEDGKVVFFGFNGSTSYSDIELEYGTEGYTAGNGIKFENFQISGLAEGNYETYVRLQCDGKTWSEWSQKIPFTILDSTKICFPPISLYAVDIDCEAKFGWYRNNKGLDEDYYQIEYGPTGFTLGTGLVETVNGIEFRDAVLTEGTSYDFYVRTNCGSTNFSENSPVESFFATKNYNKCLVPKNVDAFRSGTFLNYSFESDGDCEFEYTLVTSSQNIGDEQIYSTTNQMHSGQFNNINSFSTYNFSVRTVCKNGTKTNWVTEVVTP